MEKAYNVGALVDQLKEAGIELAEDAALVAADKFLAWLQESAELSENVYDDILVAVIPMFEAEIKKQIDKIDGKEG